MRLDYGFFLYITELYSRTTLPQPELSLQNGPMHIYSRATEDASKPDAPARRKKPPRSGHSNAVESSESSGDESTGTASRKSTGRRPSVTASRAPSRPTSRASRKRSNSTAIAAGTDKERNDKSNGKKQGMAGWASSAVSSVTGLGKKSDRDNEKFAALTGDDDSDVDGVSAPHLKRKSSSGATSSFSLRGHSKSKSKESVGAPSPKIPSRVIRTPLRQETLKVVRALYDFTGSSDELTFKAGNEIAVVNEVLDGWWMGELDGQTGLFPTTYTEIISPSQAKPSLPQRPGPLASPADGLGYVTSDAEDDHPFGDHLLANRSPMYGAFYAESVTDSAAEDEEERRLMPKKEDEDDDDFPSSTSVSWTPKGQVSTRRSIPDINATSIKRAPPPPPPRRPSSTAGGLAPPVPQRRQPSGSRPQSNSSVHTASTSSLGHDASPFDSESEIAIVGWPKFQAESVQRKQGAW